MEKDQNVNSENQNKESEEINTEDRGNEIEQNASENTDTKKEATPEEKILELGAENPNLPIFLRNQFQRKIWLFTT